jgi:hypothetical protein
MKSDKFLKINQFYVQRLMRYYIMN